MTESRTPSPRFIPLILLLGDVLALLLFVLVGQREHDLVDPVNPLPGLLLTGAIFALPWSLAAWLLGALPGGGPLTARALLARSLNAWLVAAPLAILLRSFLLGRAVIPTMFVVATLGFGGLFVLGWRVVFALVWWWRGRARPVERRPV